MSYTLVSDIQTTRVASGLPFGAVTAEWAWRGGTGQGVRVAVLDSGIDADHPAVGGALAGYMSIELGDDGLEYDDQPHHDTVGHGTACAGIIRSLAPDCALYSVRVIGSDLLGHSTVLAAGLRWAIEQGMHVCNLSLGTTRAEAAATLRDLADDAYFRNIMLVAAATNVPKRGYPWSFPSVISVAASAGDGHAFYCNPSPPVEFGANVPWTGDGGNSFAAPHLSGVVARILSKHPGLTVPEMKAILRALSVNSVGTP